MLDFKVGIGQVRLDVGFEVLQEDFLSVSCLSFHWLRFVGKRKMKRESSRRKNLSSITKNNLSAIFRSLLKGCLHVCSNLLYRCSNLYLFLPSIKPVAATYPPADVFWTTNLKTKSAIGGSPRWRFNSSIWQPPIVRLPGCRPTSV